MSKSTPSSSAACAAPSITSSGALSPPMASTAIRIELDVEVADALGVRLDELLSWLNVRTHQLLDHLREVAEEKREQQRTDVTAVDVCIGHRHDAVVADLFDVEVVAYPRTHRRDQVADLIRGQHLVQARFLNVEDLAAQRQNRL